MDIILGMMRDPYRHISKKCKRLGSDLFETHFMMQKAICMKGANATALFYQNSRFCRRNAMPEPVLATLFGKGGVQGMDDKPHQHRKQLFMSFMDEHSLAQLTRLFEKQWLQWAEQADDQQEYVLYGVLQEVIARAACQWAGVTLHEASAQRHIRDLVLMYDQDGARGLGHFRARRARTRAEKWMAGVIEDYRQQPPQPFPLSAIAHHRDQDHQLLSLDVAAVEALNLLRPIVAVSVYILDCAHALHGQAQLKPQLLEDDQLLDSFIQEVRRFYPFFPVLLARVRDTFVWKEITFEKDMRVILDVYGTNHDKALWQNPDQFRADRFVNWTPNPYTCIPQGGGNPHLGHRCPGEAITLNLMKAAVRLLCQRLEYQVPEQDLDLDWRRLPALPKDKMRITGVRLNSQGRVHPLDRPPQRDDWARRARA
ncbi:cytochrome P450 [Bowmanella dokdonensis]|uniref:Cytochrome P450 n=1 Tax=Bowmanella dokdonensis TaxID=751969 RepID=A0A939IR65_9ALTE|nr:cytochrome P450 [Bowmanella dokdonensis]MBN7825794.1 cytochrome P450 [Bowmanella dokdonensis]